MAKTAGIGIRLEKNLKAALEKAAEVERRSVASYVEGLIIRDLEAKGFLKTKK